MSVLQRDLYTCVECGRLPLDMSELEADHIVPLAAGGAALDIENGRTLCRSCHSAKTRGEQNG